MRYILLATAAIVGTFIAPHANATDCSATLTQLWAGDNGVLVTYTNGGNASMASSDVNFKQVFAVLTAAIIASKTDVIVRIAGSVCNATGQVLQGVWITP